MRGMQRKRENEIFFPSVKSSRTAPVSLFEQVFLEERIFSEIELLI